MSRLRLRFMLDRFRLPIAVLALPLLHARPLEAAPPRRYALLWSRSPGAEACPDARALEAELEQLRGPTSFVPPASADLVIEGTVRKDGGYAATIRLRGVDGRILGERKLASSDRTCRELAREVAIVSVLMIERGVADEREGSSASMQAPAVGSAGTDGGHVPVGAPDVALAASAASAAPAAASSAAATVVPTAQASAPRAAERSPPLSVAVLDGRAATRGEERAQPAPAGSWPRRRFEFGVVAGVANGVLRALRGEVGGDLWASLRAYGTVRLGVRYWGNHTVLAPGKEDAGARFEALGVLASYCPVRLAATDFHFLACAGVDIRGVFVNGVGGAESLRRTKQDVIIAPSLDVRGAYTIRDRWVVSVLGAAEVPTRRDEYQFQGAAATQTLFQPAPVAFRIESGLGYAF